LQLSNNQLSGFIPAKLGKMVAMQVFNASSNRLNGILPPSLGDAIMLIILDVHNNSLVGLIPAEFSKLYNLTVFNAGFNGLTGTVPSFRRLKKLRQISLGSNKFTGPLPFTETLPELVVLDLQDNAFSGEIPPDLYGVGSPIKYLLLSGNDLSGPVAKLPEGLVMVLLHHNAFTGPLPSFASQPNVKYLTAFGNRFGGTLSLANDTSIELLYVHSNLLSCEINAPGTSVSSSNNSLPQSLALPGNAFDGPPPTPLHLATAHAAFLTVLPNTWNHEYVMLFVGLPVLVCTVAMAAQTSLPEGPRGLRERLQVSMQALASFVLFSPEAAFVPGPARRLSRLQVNTRNILAGWSLSGLVVLLPIYISGAHLYSCGKEWLYGTAAYLANAPQVEWCFAAAACLFGLLCGVGIAALQLQEQHEQHGARNVDGTAKHTWQKECLLVLAWTPIACLLSSPMVMYVMSLSLPPGENLIGLNASFMTFTQSVIGVILYAMKSLVLPKLAQRIAKLVYRDAIPPNTAGRLMMSATAMLSMVAPILTLLWVSQDCGAAWLSLWQRCSDGKSFSTLLREDVGSFTYVGTCGGGQGACYDANDGVLTHQTHSARISLRTSITSHSDVCSPRYVADGRCPRTIIGQLGDLYMKELVASACISPTMTLLRATPQMQQAKAWVVRTLLQRPEYESRTSIDRLVFGVAMNLELPLVLGLTYPLIPVITCFVVALNAGVFHTASVYFGLQISPESPARLSTKYLWFAFSLGCALVIWLFAECDFHGRWLVTVGMPLCTLLGCTYSNGWIMTNRPWHAPPSLMEPLLTEDEAGLGVPLQEMGCETARGGSEHA